MLIRNIYKKAKPQRLSQEAQPPDHRGEPNQRVPLLTLELTFYSHKDYEFQQAETLVELHSFTLSLFIFIPSNIDYV
jgi:hypothetical protein